MYLMDAYWFFTEEDEPKVQVMCGSCHQIHDKGQAWSENKWYGDWEIVCHYCGCEIWKKQDRENYDETA